MKYRRGKRVLNRLHYFGKWHIGVRNTGSKSRKKFQERIDSGRLDVFRCIKDYKNAKVSVKAGTIEQIEHYGLFEEEIR